MNHNLDDTDVFDVSCLQNSLCPRCRVTTEGEYEDLEDVDEFKEPEDDFPQYDYYCTNCGGEGITGCDGCDMVLCYDCAMTDGYIDAEGKYVPTSTYCSECGKNIGESSEYEDLEDVDEFGEVELPCDLCGQEGGSIRCEQCRGYYCPNCARDGGGISICDNCYDDWADVMGDDLYESSEYEDLEDIDEFEEEDEFEEIDEFDWCSSCDECEAEFNCDDCGLPICSTCVISTSMGNWCADCATEADVFGIDSQVDDEGDEEANFWLREEDEYEDLEDVDEFEEIDEFDEEEDEEEEDVYGYWCSSCDEYEAEFNCDDCGLPICSTCVINTSMGNWCADCATEAEEANFWLREEGEYEGLEDVDKFGGISNGIWLQITALEHGLTEDDLLNGAREVLARRGFEVGNFQVDGRGTNPLWISGYMELPDYPAIRPKTFDGYGVEVHIPGWLRTESEYEDLEDIDEFDQGEVVEGPVWCGINALRVGMTETEMIEAAKETMIEAGYDVTGDFDIVDRGDYDDDGVAVYNKSQEVHPDIKHWICGHLDVGEIVLNNELQFRGHDVEVIIPVP